MDVTSHVIRVEKQKLNNKKFGKQKQVWRKLKQVEWKNSIQDKYDFRNQVLVIKEFTYIYLHSKLLMEFDFLNPRLIFS